jgi:hypothetical protein
MTTLVFALHLAVSSPVLSRSAVTAVSYENVPSEVIRVSLYEWRDGASPAPAPGDIDRQGGRVIVRGESGQRRVVQFERADGAYLVDGPFRWPEADAGRVLDRAWRRTIRVISPEPIVSASPLEWVSGGPERGGDWPRCLQAGERLWACWGAAAGDPGVLFCRAADSLWWTVVSQGSAPDLRSSKWGRLLVVADPAGEASGLRVRFAHPARPSSQRVPGVRLDAAAVGGAQSTLVAPGVAWLSGGDVPPESWIEIRTSRSGPGYLALQEVASGPPSLPLTARLEETRTVDGLAVGERDQRAGGALVTLFRLIDPPPSAAGSSRENPRRVLAAETMADAGGEFHIDGVGDAEYEVVAWHSLLGRGSAVLPRRPGLFTIRLASPGTARGRVVRAGKPVAGVNVMSLPALEAFRTAEDPIDVKGGDARTGEDGRFAVMLAASGGGELRVGGGVFPTRRIPLPRVPVAVLDLGDIDLGAPLEITIVLDQDSPCDVRAIGPVGQSGLQIVPGTRAGPGLFRLALPEPGLWAFGLQCGREERPLSPPAVQLSPAHNGKEVHFSIR